MTVEKAKNIKKKVDELQKFEAFNNVLEEWRYDSSLVLKVKGYYGCYSQTGISKEIDIPDSSELFHIIKEFVNTRISTLTEEIVNTQ